MVRRGIEISDSTSTNEQVKTHDEIMVLIQEIEQLEKEITKDFMSNSFHEPIFFQKDQPGDISSDTPYIPPVPEEKESAYSQIEESVASDVKTMHSKHKKVIRIRKSKEPKREKKLFYSILHPNPVRNVFTLRLSDQGDLVGFDLEKPLPERKKLSLKEFFKKKARTSSDEASEELPKGIKGKILGFTRRLHKSAEATGEGTTKVSGVMGRLKGIFSRGT